MTLFNQTMIKKHQNIELLLISDAVFLNLSDKTLPVIFLFKHFKKVMSNSLQFYKRAKKEYETNRPLAYEFSLTKTDNKCKKFMIILGKFIQIFKSGMKQDYKYEAQESDNYWQELEKHFGQQVEMKYIMSKIYEGKEVKLRLLFMLLLNNKKLFEFINTVIEKVPYLYNNPREKVKSIDGELEPIAFFKDGQFKIFTVTPNYIEEFKLFWQEEQTKKMLFIKQIREVVFDLLDKVEKNWNQMLQREKQKQQQIDENERKIKLKEENERQRIERDILAKKIQGQTMNASNNAPFKQNQKVTENVKAFPAQTIKNKETTLVKFTPEMFMAFDNIVTPTGVAASTPDHRQLLQKKPRSMKNSEYLFQIRYKDELQTYENDTHPFNFEFTISQDKSKCTECNKQLSRGLIILGSDMNLCNYSGKWFCNDCMAAQRIQVPHKAKFYFDLRSYQVSKQAYERIRFYYQRPIIEFRYDQVVVLEHKKLYDFLVLKRQLHLMYDSICNPDFMNKTFGKKINYVLKRNLFSLKNLYDIYNGHESEQIERDFGILQRHFYKCQICQTKKGRLCSICKNAPKIFAFQLKQTYSCKHCHRIFHRRCLTGNKCACETSTLH